MTIKADFLRNLHPAYFAVVMATGIISNDFFAMGNRLLSVGLFYVGIAAWLSLCVIFLSRAIFFSKEFRADLTDAKVMFSFFTFVAGTGVLGVHLALESSVGLAKLFWVFSIVSWLPLTYLTFSVLTLKNSAPIEQVANGGWLLLIVGTQSVSILTSYITGSFSGFEGWAIMLSLAIWGIGVVFYFIFIILLVYRLSFFKVEPPDLAPPYWINMGAAAISTVAGTTLYSVIEGTGALSQFGGGVMLVSVVLWGWETWWLPLLFLFGFWRHFVKHYTLKYEPVMWSMVFVLGMYGKASWNLGTALEMQAFHTLATFMTWVAFAAWILVAVDLILFPKAR
ncbi:MAG: tellurite resistance/C4-dicarboxylate transporter family protein [Nitrososphaerota archaeon]|jgi:tellurite resistance protein TehA-like permease|nr:tellurite resistance/C4-dicarboxylate transporter family protein [Nitrososphaerota archaeon]